MLKSLLRGLFTGNRGREKRDGAEKSSVIVNENAAPRDIGGVAVVLEQAENLEAQGRFGEGLELARRAQQLDSADPRVNFVLAKLLLATGDAKAAMMHARYAEKRLPNNAAFVNQVGVIFLALGGYGKAKKSFSRAMTLNPTSPEILNNMGIACRHSGNPHKAAEMFQRALGLNPDDMAARLNFALASWESNQVDIAETELLRLLEQCPTDPSILLNLAVVYASTMRVDEARQLLSRLPSEILDGDDVRGLLVQMNLAEGNVQQALSDAYAVWQRSPSASSAYVYSEILLGLQRYEEGWQLYDNRLAMPGYPYRDTPLPRWSGESLQGKSIYLQSEQGIGDYVMFSRAFPYLLNAGASVTAEVEERLLPLYARNFPEIRFVSFGKNLLPSAPRQGFDFAAYIGSLPRWLDLPRCLGERAGALLTPDPLRMDNWRVLRGSKSAMVGLCWRGGLDHTGMLRRTVSLQSLAPLLEMEDACFLSLQRDETEEELNRLVNQENIIPYSRNCDDFEELAAAIAACDIVVTVCCSVAHFAGALGRPALVMTPAAPAWRYGFEGAGMPWYSSLRLIRQRADGWEGVVGQVRELLHAYQGKAS